MFEFSRGNHQALRVIPVALCLKWQHTSIFVLDLGKIVICLKENVIGHYREGKFACSFAVTIIS